MKTVNRTVRIEWRNNPSVFEAINKAAFATSHLRLSATMGMANWYLARQEELDALLPTILGSSPKSDDWEEKCTEYVHDFLVEIPRDGMEWNIGYTLSLTANKTKVAIDSYIDKMKRAGIKDVNFNDDSFILACMQGVEFDGKFKVDEDDLYRYVTFINPRDYFNWRAALKSSTVANKPEDVYKSTKIKFFLVDGEHSKLEEAKIIQDKNKAIRLYAALLEKGDNVKLNHILIAGKKIENLKDFDELTDINRLKLLNEFMESSPERFVQVCEDKSNEVRARITVYLWSGLLRYIPGSEIITDAHNTDRVLGNNMEATIAFFNDPINQGYCNELLAKYKSQK